MAKAAAKPAENEAPKKGGKKVLIIVGAVVVLALAGGGFMMMKGHGAAEGDKPHAERSTRSEKPVFVTLEPFTTNLAQEGDGDHYVQIVMVLRVADGGVEEELKTLMPELRHRVNLLLASKLPSELATMEGRAGLADVLRDQANEVLGYEAPKRKSNRAENDAPVREVLFNSFIIQ